MIQDPGFAALLSEVRGRLRVHRLHRALGTALRVTAAVCVAVVPVHLWLHSLPVAAIAGLLLVAWLVILAASVRNPPTPADCADWADRRLEGASAYATALEATQLPRTEGSSEALAWLEIGMRGRVEHSRRLLRALKTDPRLGRPALIAAVCLALALSVLQLPGRAGAGLSSATGAPAAGDKVAAATVEPARSETALATAMREAQQSEAREGRMSMTGREQNRPAEGQVSGDPDAKNGLPAVPPDDGSEAERSSAADRRRQGEFAQADEGAGREAGGSPDRGSLAGPEDGRTANIDAIRRELVLDGDTEGRRADASLRASFTSGTERTEAGPAVSPAPARPPSATGNLGRSPADAAYVAAYFEARGSR